MSYKPERTEEELEEFFQSLIDASEREDYVARAILTGERGELLREGMREKVDAVRKRLAAEREKKVTQ